MSDDPIVIEKLYEGLSGFQHAHKIDRPTFFPTYGEIPPASVQIYFKEIEFTNNDVFYDLGSGIGKITTQVYLETPVKKSVGVEYLESRHNLACEVYKKIEKDNNRILEFIKSDFMEVDFSDATIIYLCSTCFSQEVMTKLYEKITTKCPNIKAVISLKPLDDTKNFFTQPKVINTPSTWSSSTVSHIYYKSSNQVIKKYLKMKKKYLLLKARRQQ